MTGEPGPPERPAVPGRPRPRRRWALWLFLLPLAAVVYPPLYNHDRPALGGLPFFVWYQLAAVAFGGLVTGVVYFLRGGDSG